MANRPPETRRALLSGLAAAPVLAALSASAIAQPAAPPAAGGNALSRVPGAPQLIVNPGTQLVMLGTGGGPQLGQTRHMTSHAILHDGAVYLVDCGYGCADQMVRAGVPLSRVRKIFITHHHSDHNIELGPLLTLTWLNGLTAPLDIYGPPPVADMTVNLLKASKATVDFWIEDMHLPAPPPMIGHDLPSPGPVMQDDKVKVTCVLAQHPPLRPAFAYRFDFADRSLVFSGDTVALESIAKLAQGVDVLVHEAMYLPAIPPMLHAMIPPSAPGGPDIDHSPGYATAYDHMMRDHTPAEDVGRIAQEAGVKMLVLSHLTPGTANVTDKMWRDAAATTFKGEIVIASDLMVI